jgi:IS5 family transposase
MGVKIHIGMDADNELVHTVKGTVANVSDVVEVNGLLHGEETDFFGDAGYEGAAKRPDEREDVQRRIAMRPGKRRALDKSNQIDALIDKVEHPSRTIKEQF